MSFDHLLKLCLYTFSCYVILSHPTALRLDRIVSHINLHKKSQFIPRLVSYWKLKRQSRNGVPLLRRLQANNKGQRTSTVVG